MKRIAQLLALVGLAVSLNSCGLPEMLGRTAGRTLNSVSNAAGALR